VTTHTHPSWQRPLQTLPVLLGLMLQAATATATLAKPTQAPQRFVVIPKVHHSWFDAVCKGAQAATVMIEAQTGGTASIDYRAPSHADP
jgi:ABC-type sugar transport system substrate-binding protein